MIGHHRDARLQGGAEGVREEVAGQALGAGHAEQRRMGIDEHPRFGRGLEDRQQLGIVEQLAADRRPDDDRPHAEVLHHVLQLAQRGIAVLHREHGQAAKIMRVGLL